MIIFLICISVINAFLLLYLLISFQKQKVDKKEENPYIILIKSIQMLQYSNYPTRLCCTDKNIIELFKRNLINEVELNFQYHIQTGFYLENLVLELNRCLHPDTEVLCLRFDKFVRS